MMVRFASLAELGTHSYNAAELASMSDKELVDEINRLDDWDADLLHELVWRAFPDCDQPWECGDAITYEAANKLGFEI